MSAVFDVAPEQLAARARLELLFDPGTFRPIRTAVGDGVLSGSGRVQGRAVVAWAQDGAFKGGSLGSAGGETIARTIARADALGVPVVGFPHSGGARLQEGVAALTAYAAIFRAQALATVPMISVVSGPCAGGAAYSPALGDFVVMTADAVMFLTGPKIIERVTREVISAAELGGPKVHGRNGVSHMVARDDVHAAELTRELLTYLPDRVGGAGAPLVPPAAAPGEDPGDVLPASDRQVYDVREVAARLLDRGSFLELAPKWARNLVVGFGRVEGRAVGVIANQPKHLGGCLDADAAEKGSWFVQMCDRFAIPLVVLSDTPGFLPGARQEAAGVLRHGAALLRAFGAATVPRVTVTLRQAYGGAHIVMNSRDLGATLTLAWPNARIGVMGARQAVELVRRREIEAGADAAVLADAYEAEHLPVRVAATAGFVDEVVAPSETRDRIAHVLEPGQDVSHGGEPLELNESRNATEEAILDAARDALADTEYRRLTMDVIARRAFVSRTALYFYFPNKRALVDRLILRAFLDMYEAAAPYLDGSGDPRAELRRGLARTVRIIDRDGHVLTLAAMLSGEEDRLPPQWLPYVVRFVEGATARIARDQARGIAPSDIPPRLAAQALLAMVERHITLELIQGGGDAHQSIRVLAELWWRAVYSKPDSPPPGD